MPKRRRPRPPTARVRPVGNRGIAELDRFTAKNLTQWKSYSEDLDELFGNLFFGVRPHQRRLRGELVEALQGTEPQAIELTDWCRIVPYRYSNEPLSCAGSLQGSGGRFNVGVDLDADTLQPWPALYLAEDYETAFRERFQLPQDETVEGLTPKELALELGASHSTVLLRGRLNRVFDVTSARNLEAVAHVLKRIKMPPRARTLKARLRVDVKMIQSAAELFDAVFTHNWRTLPVQFGLPSPSQMLAELIRAADFEAILYRSSKGPRNCLVVFPCVLSSGSFIELTDPAPATVAHRRLDCETADQLAGWQSIPRQYWPR